MAASGFVHSSGQTIPNSGGVAIERTVYSTPDVVTKYAVACPELAERDGDQVIAEYDNSDTLLRKFIYGPGIDEPIYLVDGRN